jgi:hypothetical protein
MASITGSLVGLENGRSGGRMGWAVDGLRLRSGLEVLLVLAMRANDMIFEYEPTIFKLKDGLRYKPDFYLPAQQRWIEVKGKMSARDEAKIEALRSLGERVDVFMQKDVEAFSGLSYRTLLKSGAYRA